MVEKHLHIVDVEPDMYIMYVDGEKHSHRHRYEKTDDLINLLENSYSYVVTQEHINCDWKGVPQTIEEGIKMYQEFVGPES